MNTVIFRFNNEILVSAETKDKAIEKLAELYGFKIEDTDEAVVDFEGAKHLQSYVDGILQARAEEKVQKFNRQFFHTSLGYVRRKVSMAGTGEEKNFLSDILPLLQVGTPIITYNYMAENQNSVEVTEEFLQECKQQLLLDFYPKDEEVENDATVL